MLPCQLSQNDYCYLNMLYKFCSNNTWCWVLVMDMSYPNHFSQMNRYFSSRFGINYHAKTSKCKSMKFANNHGYKDWSNPSNLGLSSITYSKTWPCYAKFHHMLLAPGRAQWLATTPHKHYKLRKYCSFIQVRETGWISHTNSFQRFRIV